MAESEDLKETTKRAMADAGIEAMRLKLSFAKFIIGTVAVSVLTAVLNWQIKVFADVSALIQEIEQIGGHTGWISVEQPYPEISFYIINPLQHRLDIGKS